MQGEPWLKRRSTETLYSRKFGLEVIRKPIDDFGSPFFALETSGDFPPRSTSTAESFPG